MPARVALSIHAISLTSWPVRHVPQRHKLMGAGIPRLCFGPKPPTTLHCSQLCHLTCAPGCAGAGVVRAGVARADGGVLGGVAGRAAVLPPAGRAAGEDPGGCVLRVQAHGGAAAAGRGLCWRRRRAKQECSRVVHHAGMLGVVVAVWHECFWRAQTFVG